MSRTRAHATAEPLPLPWPHPLRVASLDRSRPTRFDLQADEAARAAIAEHLGLLGIDSLRFRGELAPVGAADWRMTGRLTADVVQECVVTLEPLSGRIDERIGRDFLADAGGLSLDLDLDAEDEPDEFTDVIDPGAVAIEALALALDPYPRAPGTDPVDARAAPPGADPLDNAALKPFAGLAALRDKMQGG